MCPVFAQIGMPQSTPAEIGTWLIPAVAVFGIGILVLRGMNEWKVWRAAPKVDRDGETVTRAELEKIERELSGQFTRHEGYTRDRLHELSNSLQTLSNKFAGQPMETRIMIDAAMRPIQEKVDVMSVTVAAIGAKMGITTHAKN